MTADHAHDRPGPLAHHFTELEQQSDSVKMGMWIFLLTEILLFGGLFVAYTVFRAWNEEMFINAHKFLDIYLGTINTIVLISSSATVALAIRAVQIGDRRKAVILLTATLALAVVFLVVKYFEYSHKFHLGQLPGKYYTFTGVEGSNPHIFFGIYFATTGLHGLHVLGGIIVLGWMLFRTARGDFSPEYHTPLEAAGLYWHLVDMIWIYLFPLLYLIG